MSENTTKLSPENFSSGKPSSDRHSSGRHGTLYIVATPIGNLDDMTPRAIQTLKTVDIIACEDTRTSSKLLNHFNIDTKAWAYHEHNADVQTDKFIELLQQGTNIALISDAGTPLVSDPGYQLVLACHNANIKTAPVVGASAAIGALSVAGLPSDKFSFMGFLPAKSAARIKQLETYANKTETLIFYEAPHRIVASLTDMATVFGENRQIAFCRELTKTFETVHKCTLGELVEFVKNDNNQQKGEIVLVVSGKVSQSDDNETNTHDKLLLRLLEDLSVKKAAALAADITGVKKNTLYKRLLELT